MSGPLAGLAPPPNIPRITEENIRYPTVMQFLIMSSGEDGLGKVVSKDLHQKIMLSAIGIANANAGIKKGLYPEAKWENFQVLFNLTDKHITIPGVQDDLYYLPKGSHSVQIMKATLMILALCGVVESLIGENKLEEALDWLQEIDIAFRAVDLQDASSPKFDWIINRMPIPDYTLGKAKRMKLARDIFLRLGNTALAVYYSYESMHYVGGVEEHEKSIPEIDNSSKGSDLTDIFCLRHPDPTRILQTEVSNPSLQLRGSWIKLKSGAGTMLRMSFASFIYQSRLYVVGGRREPNGPFYHDMWSLDLTNAKSSEWRKENFTQPANAPNKKLPFFGWQMRVYEDNAWLIIGSPVVSYFDLKTKKWETITTTYKPTKEDKKAGIDTDFPYVGPCVEYTMQLSSKGKAYIFGGSHPQTRLGCNLFMELDLKTRKWRRLSGYKLPRRDQSMPGPRVKASSWLNKDETKFYLIGGEANREAAQNAGEPYGASRGFAITEFWSFDIATEKWSLERWSGSYPAPRSEMGCCYNPKLDQVIVHGGYTPCAPSGTKLPPFTWEYSYYADTFCYKPNSSTSFLPSRWRQVLCRGFPNYRCQGELLADPDTGKTYLYGGAVSSQFVPTTNRGSTKSYGDVWELRMDVPGGHFEGIDEEEEKRTAAAGPYQRCFACADAGPWKRCGGSCKGKAYFCGKECQKDGWKDHKRMHGCSK